MAKIILDRYLERKGISKRRFAQMIRMDYASVFRFFRPGYDPKFSMLARWAKALKCRVRDLFEE